MLRDNYLQALEDSPDLEKVTRRGALILWPLGIALLLLGIFLA